MTSIGRRGDAKSATQNQLADLARAGDEHGLRLGAQGPRPQADAGAVAPLGGETLVNTITAEGQNYAQAAALAGGGYVVAWTSSVGTNPNAYARVFGANGAPVAGEFRVNTDDSGDVLGVAALTGGRFVVTWFDYDTNAIEFRVYAADGTPVGTDLAVNNSGINATVECAVAGLEGGGFVITWQADQSAIGSGFFVDRNIYAQRFTVDGAAVGSRFTVNSALDVPADHIDLDVSPSVAALPGGGFIITWTDTDRSGGNAGDEIYARRYSSTGAALGAEFLVAALENNVAVRSEVATLKDGSFVITWSYVENLTQWHSFARVYDSTGAVVAGDVPVADGYLASVTALANGGFLATYGASDGDGVGVFARQFTATGEPVGAAFAVNQTVAGTQELTPGRDAVQLADGSVAFVWNGSGPGDDFGIVTRRFALADNIFINELHYNNAGADTGEAIEIAGAAGLSLAGWSLALYDGATGTVYGTVALSGTLPGQQNGFGTLSFAHAGLQDNLAGIALVNALGQVVQFLSYGGAFTATAGPASGLTSQDISVAESESTVAGFSLQLAGSGRAYESFTWGNAADDNFGAVNTGQTFAAANTPPIAVDDGVTTEGSAPGETHPVTINVRANDSDRDGGALTVLSVADPAHGSAVINGDGTITYTADSGFVGTDVFQYTLGDAAGGTSTGNVSINVTPDYSGVATGPEVRIGGPMPSGTQEQAQIAAFGDGSYVLIWVARANEGPGFLEGNIIGHRYDASGTAVGAEFVVNGSTAGTQDEAAVTTLTNGGFVVTWRSNLSGNAAATGTFAQLFDATGQKAGTEFRVTDERSFSSVAAIDGGKFVISWRAGTDTATSDVMGQIYDSAGAAQGGPIQLSTTDGVFTHALAHLSGSGFVAIYLKTAASGETFYGQRFDTNGVKIGGEFTVNTIPLEQVANQVIETPSVVALAGGGFVVAWAGQAVGDDRDIYARRYAADGSPIGAEFQVNEGQSGLQGGVSVAALAGGGFIVGWTDYHIGPSPSFSEQYQPVARAYDANGVALGAEFIVEELAEAVSSNALLQLADGSVAIVYNDENINSTGPVYLQRYVIDAAVSPGGSTSGPDTLDGTGGDDSLSGLGGDDTLNGLGGNDLLDGGTGNDVLNGGAGDDTYFVDSANDQVIEGGAGGADVIYAQTGYVLGAGQEVEVLSAYDQGGTGAQNLTGNALAQTLIGNAGDNLLVGVGGADAFYGLGGNDTYVVDSADDQVIEYTGQGNDTVYAMAGYALTAGQEIEVLSAYDQAGTAPLALAGNAFAQTIIGNAGANLLDGGDGADSLYGLGGDDTYFADSAGDQVIEGASGGTDVVYARTGYVLAAGQEIEVLSAFDQTGTGAQNLTGNALAQTLIGNAGDNLLDGGGGADALYGLGGADSFAFTTALGGGNADLVVGFTHGTDRIALDDAIFAGIGTATFNANAFATGTAAADGDDRIVYDNLTGQLYYDADGSGAGAQVLFATLNGAPNLTASDFLVI
jgi:hypothetical protein